MPRAQYRNGASKGARVVSVFLDFSGAIATTGSDAVESAKHCTGALRI